jgi:hypothetical protein
MPPEGPRVIDLPEYRDERGTLSVIEFAGSLPFVPQRFYFIHDVPPRASRAGHAHWNETEGMIAFRGTFTVTLYDGTRELSFRLNSPSQILIIPPRHWHVLGDFTEASLCGVFASHPYDPLDYCRDREEFRRSVRP